METCRTCAYVHVNGLHVYCKLKKRWIPLDDSKTACPNYAPNPILKHKKPIGSVPIW